MSIFTIVVLILTFIILLYLYYEYAGDAIKRRRTIFEIKMLWMGTKGNYEDAIMKQFNIGSKFNYKDVMKKFTINLESFTLHSTTVQTSAKDCCTYRGQ